MGCHMWTVALKTLADLSQLLPSIKLKVSSCLVFVLYLILHSSAKLMLGW